MYHAGILCLPLLVSKYTLNSISFSVKVPHDLACQNPLFVLFAFVYIRDILIILILMLQPVGPIRHSKVSLAICIHM